MDQKRDNSRDGFYRSLFSLWFALWPFYFGLLLPMKPLAGRHFLNIIWGFLYDFGFTLQITLFGYQKSLWNILGTLVWPLLLTATLFWIGGDLWKNATSRTRNIGAALLFASGFLVLDSNTTAFGRLPAYLWLGFMD